MLIKKTIVLTDNSRTVGHLSIIRVGQETGAKLTLIKPMRGKLYLKVGGKEQESIKVDGVKSEKTLMINLASGDVIGAVLTDEKGKTCGKGGVYEIVNIKPAVEKKEEIKHSNTDIEEPKQEKIEQVAQVVSMPEQAERIEQEVFEPEQVEAIEQEKSEPKQAEVTEQDVSEPEQAEAIEQEVSEAEQVEAIEQEVLEPEETETTEEKANEQDIKNEEDVETVEQINVDNESVESQTSVISDKEKEVIKEKTQETAEPVPMPFNFIKGENFYKNVRGKLAEIMTANPTEKRLEELIPDSKWVKVYYDKGEYYVVGILSEDGDVKFLAYGVPGVRSVKPPKDAEELCDFVELSGGIGEGYWIMFQNAKNGEIVKSI